MSREVPTKLRTDLLLFVVWSMYVLKFDGACMPHPGVGGAGWHYEDDYGVYYCCGYSYSGESTENGAEYSTLIAGLTVAKWMG